jgi:hypothetical protein
VANEVQLSARSVAGLLSQIFGPSIFDLPRFGGGDPSRLNLSDLISGPQPDPWQTVMLNPQPLPPRESFALALADVQIQEVLRLDGLATLLGGEVAERALGQAVRSLADLVDICPEWPRWPKGWPKAWPPPPPDPWPYEVMTPTALLVYGSRFLAASDVVEQGQLRDALTELGAKAMNLSMEAGSDRTSGSP